MKRLFYLTILALALPAAALLTGCHHEMQALGNPEARTGVLRMQVSCNGEFKSKASLGDASDFRLLLTRDDDWSKTWDRVADLPQELRLAPGFYRADVSSRDTLPAAFDQPIYKGSVEFEISAGVVTPVTVNCSLANMKVSVSPSATLIEELSDYRITITNAPSWDDADIARHTLVWDKATAGAGKPGFFTVAPLLVKVYGHRAIDGGEAVAEYTISDVAARDYHLITVDAVVTGQATFGIVIDESIVEKNEEILVPGWEEAPVDGHHEDEGDNPGGGGGTSATAPSLSWAANPDFEPTPIEATMDINITISAPEKIASFVISVDSDILSDVIAQLAGDTSYSYANNGPYDMDLIGNATLVTVLGGMGVPTGDQILGQTSVLFSLSDLVPLILIYSPASGSQHIFTLKVVDEKGQRLEQSLTFYAK